MRESLVLSAAAMGALLVLGCGSWSQDNDPAAWTRHDAAEWRIADTSPPHQRQSQATTLPSQAETELPPDAGAEDYVRIAVENNPSIRSAEAKVRRLAAGVPQATSLEDPMLEVTPIGDMPETAAGATGLMTGLRQELPFPGKLKTRERIASQDVASAQKDLQQVRLSVIAETRQAFWSYYVAARAIEVTRESQNLLSQFQQAAEAKYRANTATQQDVLRASLELSSLDNELITLVQQQTTAAAMLNSLMDRTVTGPLPLPKPVKLEPSSLRLEELLAEAARNNPELGSIRERIEAQRQRIKLARLQRWPNLTVGVSYNTVEDMGMAPTANGKDQWWVSFAVNLPIWLVKLQAAQREAQAGLHEAVADLASARNRLAFKVQDAYVRVDTQQRLAMLLKDVIIPQARQTLDASAGGYRAGNTDFLMLIDTWRKLLSYQLMYHQTHAEYEKDYAQLQQALGRDLPRPTRSSPPSPPPVSPAEQYQGPRQSESQP